MSDSDSMKTEPATIQSVHVKDQCPGCGDIIHGLGDGEVPMQCSECDLKWTMEVSVE